MNSCACGSMKNSEQCCVQYINSKAPAPTAESLMRSRYTAYTQRNIDYIAKTMRGPALAGFDPRHAAEWTKQIKWLKLEIIKASTETDTAQVEFIAHYLFQGRRQKLHEVSEFQCIDGCWYYIDGRIIE